MLSVIAEAKSNSADTSGYPRTKEDLIRQDHENERKMQTREDILYPTMKDSNQIKNNYSNIYKNDYIQNVLNDHSITKSVMYEPISENYGYNEDYKPIHDTYRKILIDANTYAGKANIDGFTPYFSDANHKTGFYGRAYINNKDKTVVIAYKGTDPLSFKKDWYDNNIKMWKNKEMPVQFKDAEQFYFDVREKLIKEGKNYKFDFAGYSLGGTLAQLMGAKYGNETVTFNAFGIGQMKNAQINYKTNIINYGHKYDRVYNWKNTQQIGKNIYTKNEGEKDTLTKFWKYHELQNMGDLRDRY